MCTWNIFREHEFRNFVEFERKLFLNFRNLGIMIRNFFFSSFLFSYKRVLKGFGCGCPNLEISATHLLSIIWKITLKILKNWVVCSMNMGNLWVLMRVNGSPCINRSSWCRMILLLPADPTESTHTDKSPSGYLAAFWSFCSQVRSGSEIDISAILTIFNGI